MNDVERLYREFVAEHKAGGEADPRAFLDQLDDEVDRLELAALVEHYLESAPGRSWDPEAFATSKAAQVADSILAEWELEGEREEETVGWRELLPALRTRAQIMRREVVERLAEALGAADKQEKVGVYYHRMELEELPVEGVSDRVLAALGEILGESAETLRRAGRVRTGDEQIGPGVAFSRTAFPREEFAREEAAASRQGMPSPGEEAERDYVDELFTGGRDAGRD
jgi:hypothetical protein